MEDGGSSSSGAKASGDVEGASKGKAKTNGGETGAKKQQKSDKDGGKKNGQPDAEQRKSKSPWLAWDREGEDAAANGKSTDNTSTDDNSAGPSETSQDASNSTSPAKDPYGAVDLVIEDYKAEERERLLERRRGDPALRAGKGTRIFRKQYTPTASGSSTPTTEHKPKQIEREGSPSTPLNPPSSTAAAVTVNGGGGGGRDRKVKVELEDAKKGGDGMVVSRRIDVDENEEFLKGRVLSPEPPDEGNPWA